MEDEDKYIKGFNMGYQFGKHRPGLINDILENNDSKSPQMEGMRAGKKQWEKERMMQHMHDRDKQQLKNRGLDR